MIAFIRRLPRLLWAPLSRARWRLLVSPIPLLLVLLLPDSGFADDSRGTAATLGDFPQAAVEIVTPDARVHRFTLWIAASEAHREQGLMFVKELAADRGMLFTFPQPRPVSMWMKNTYIPLDMLFVGADGRVEKIIANARPLSLDILASTVPVRWVIELAGGVAHRENIVHGAQVNLPAN